jgi:hypothetical protein
MTATQFGKGKTAIKRDFSLCKAVLGHKEGAWNWKAITGR